MELATFNQFLAAAVKNGASDVHFKVGSAPALRVNGQLLPVKVPALQAEDTNRIAKHLLAQGRYKGTIEELQDWDTSYALEGVGRFRANIFRNKGHLGAVMRSIPLVIPDFQKLGLPKVLEKISQEDRGLILVTGVTGSGKSSTLAAIVQMLNESRQDHIITVEDPIEYVFSKNKCVVNQRQAGKHTQSFANALRAALREDPDIIVIGELRDLETIQLAITAAETGHLVLGTLHTNNAIRTINRVLDVFPPKQQSQIRAMVSESLRAIVSQRLIRREDGQGRAAAIEILLNTPNIADRIIKGEFHEIKSVMARSRELGMCTFDAALYELYNAGLISFDDALRNADSANELRLQIKLKSDRGEPPASAFMSLAFEEDPKPSEAEPAAGAR